MAQSETKTTSPKATSQNDKIKALYQKGVSHYKIAEEVFEFVNEDTLKRVAEVVNPTAAKESERYKS